MKNYKKKEREEQCIYYELYYLRFLIFMELFPNFVAI